MQRNLLKAFLNLLSQFGIDPLRFFNAIKGITAYLVDLRTFRRQYHGSLKLTPCLHDRYEEGGITKSEYFWQDLLVARWIFEANPRKHVDVGSRVDGFVAHVASFRELEVLDVRPISTSIPGVIFRQIDLMSKKNIDVMTEGGGYCDSLSCLHVLEHFGLGRYGDKIDSQGYQLGMANLSSLLENNGTLYLGTPIGQERVEFNANWVFSPLTILSLARQNSLLLHRFLVFSPYTGLKEIEKNAIADEISKLSVASYHLAIMIFFKKNPDNMSSFL